MQNTHKENKFKNINSLYKRCLAFASPIPYACYQHPLYIKYSNLMAGTAPYEGGCNPLFDFDWALGQLAWLDWFGAVIEMYSTQYMLAEDKALAYMLFNVKNRYFLNPTKL